LQKSYNLKIHKVKKIEEMRRKHDIQRKRFEEKHTRDKIGNLKISFKNSNIRRSFIACCIKGGLNNTQQILDAYAWALSKNYIKKDNYVNIHYEDFAKKVSEKFKTIFHNDWKIRPSKTKQGHFWIIDAKHIKIFFDSAFPRNYGNFNFNFINKII